jgi:hypothetical protein
MRSLLLLSLMFLLCLTVGYACNDDDDDDDSGELDDDDDSSTDDDDASPADDDDATGDDDDDNDTSDQPPVLSNAYWDPNPIEQDPSSGNWISYLKVSVCDPDDDLLGGMICFGDSENPNPHIDCEQNEWDDFDPVPSAPDCSAPVEVAWSVNFTLADPGEYCAYIEVTDGAANFSNKLEDICVTMP